MVGEGGVIGCVVVFCGLILVCLLLVVVMVVVVVVVVAAGNVFGGRFDGLHLWEPVLVGGVADGAHCNRRSS